MKASNIFSYCIILLCTCLSGCASKMPPTNLQSIQILAENKANQNSATAIDLVLVYDASILPIMPVTGPTWFEQKTALRNRLASAIKIVPMEITPIGTVLPMLGPDFPDDYKKAIAVYSYVNFSLLSGQAMINLTPYGSTVIRLTPDNVVVTGEPPVGMMRKLLNKLTGN